MRLRTLLIPLALIAVPAVAIQAVAAAEPSDNVEHLVAVQTSADGLTNIVAAGPVTGVGVDETLKNDRDRLVLDDGSLLIDHKAARTDANFDPAACVTRLVETGTYTVVGGSGAYRHAQGHATYETHLLAQGCSQDRPPTSYLLTIEASGPLSV